MNWEWIDKDAESGPLFRVGPDTYVRHRPDSRVVRLTTTHAPGLDYLTPAVEAFAACAEHFGAPIVFVLEPDVKKPPAVRFLYEWSQAAWLNGSVDQSWFLMHGPFSRFIGQVVCRAFCSGGMPFEAVAGHKALDEKLDEMDLSLAREGFALKGSSTALVTRRGLGEGPYGQLVARALRKVRGS